MERDAAHARLLMVDGAINLVLGAVVLLAPVGSLRVVGVPTPSTFLFTTVLGGVLVGIGVALFASARGSQGLGLVGAIAINVCGATAVVLWLLSSDNTLEPRGTTTLWVIAVLVLIIAALEVASKPWRDY